MGPTLEWDVAAGMRFTQAKKNHNQIVFNKENLLNILLCMDFSMFLVRNLKFEKPKQSIDVSNSQHPHLDELENEGIYVMREVAAQFRRPVLLFSGEKTPLSCFI